MRADYELYELIMITQLYEIMKIVNSVVIHINFKHNFDSVED